MNKIYTLLLCFLVASLRLHAQYDAQMQYAYCTGYMTPNATARFTAAIKIVSGTASATNYAIGWQVDNGPVNTWQSDPQNLYDYITSIGVKQIDKANFNFTITTPGTHKLKAWIRVTTPADNNMSNDTFVKIIKVLPYLPPKEIVLETYKHQNCGPCYPAANFLHDAMESKPDYSIVNCYSFYQDLIYTPEADTINATYLTAHPESLIDRVFFPFNNTIYLNYIGGNSVVLEDTGMRERILEPLDVKFNRVQYDAATRLLKVQLKSKAYDTLAGEYRFNVFLTEDSLKVYQAGAPNPNSYYHRRVLRRMTGGPWGQPGSMTTTKLIGGQEYIYEFQYTLPAAWKPENMHITGLVQKYNAADINDRRILNSCHATFAKALTTGITETGMQQPLLQLYPNPATDVLNIAAEDLNGTITVISSLGQTVEVATVAHRRELSISTAIWAAGVYSVIYNDGSNNYAYKIVKQ